MNSVVDYIRKTTGDSRPDEAILFEWGSRVRDARRPDLFDANPDAAEQFFEMEREMRDSPQRTLWTGIKSGVTDQLPKLGTDLGEMLLRTQRWMTPDLDIGALQDTRAKLGEAADWMAEQSRMQEEEAADKRDPFGVQSLKEARSPSDYLNLGSRMVGENLPQLALSFVPGAAVGKIAQAAALARGATAGAAAVQAGIAAGSAAYVSNALQNTADIYSSLDTEAKNSGKGIATSLAGGAVAGALDTLGESLPLSRMFPGLNKRLFAPVITHVLDRGGYIGAVSKALATGSMEAVTEALQEAVSVASEEYAQGKEIPTDVIRDRMMNAGFGGGALGLLTGGVAGAFKVSEQEDLKPKVEGTPPAAPPAPGATPTQPPAPPTFPFPKLTPYVDPNADMRGPDIPTGRGAGLVPGTDPLDAFFGQEEQRAAEDQSFNQFLGQPAPQVGRQGFVNPALQGQLTDELYEAPVGGTGLLPGMRGDEDTTPSNSPITNVTKPVLTPAPGAGVVPAQEQLSFDSPPPIDAPPGPVVKSVADGLGLTTPAVVNPNAINKVAKQVEAANALQQSKPARVPKAKSPGRVPEVEEGVGSPEAPAQEGTTAPQVADGAHDEAIDQVSVIVDNLEPKGNVLKLATNFASRGLITAKQLAALKATAKPKDAGAEEVGSHLQSLLTANKEAAPAAAGPVQKVSVKISPAVNSVLNIESTLKFLDGATFTDGVLDMPASTATAMAEQARTLLASEKFKPTAKQRKELTNFAADLEQQAAALSPTKTVVGKVAGAPIVIDPTKPLKAKDVEPLLGVSPTVYIGKNDVVPTNDKPIFGRVFDSTSGDRDSRIAQASGSATGKSMDKIRRRAVILLDKATGKVHVRQVWSEGKNSTKPGKGIRIANTGRMLKSGEKGYTSKGSRGLDLETGRQSTAWEALSKETHGNEARFDVLGYLHWTGTEDGSNFSFKNMDTFLNSSAMKEAFDVLYKSPDELDPEVAEDLLAEKHRREGLLGSAGSTIPLEQVANTTQAATEGSPATEAEAADKTAEEQEAALSTKSAKMREVIRNLLMITLAKNTPPTEKSIRPLIEELVTLRGYGKKDATLAVGRLLALAGSRDKFIKTLRETSNSLTQATRQLPGSFVASVPEAAATFSHALAVLQRHGVDVFLASSRLLEAYTNEANARGVTITDSQGKAMIGLAVDYLNGKITNEDVVRLYHEATHVFTNRLPQWQQQMFFNAVSNLPWQRQKWLSTGYGMDARVIANTPREEMGPAQQAMLDNMTPEQLTVLRGTDPSVIQLERGVEHLAALGIEEAQARDILSQIIRFVKGMMLRTALELQRLFKGEADVSENLARAYVENQWLQFINKDFANSDAALAVPFRQFIGTPMNDHERVAVYDNINGEAQNFYYTPGTGFRENIPPSTDSTAGLIAYHNILSTEKKLGQMTQLMSVGQSVPMDALQYLTGGVAFEDLTMQNQLAVLAVAKKEIDAVQLEKNAKGELLAPNGQVSELPELQWKMVRTSFFKRWFGDWIADPANSSKVINKATGEPRIVYHGTVAENEFTIFSVFQDLGHHFGRFAEARDRIASNREYTTGKLPDSSRVFATFLNIRNPAPLMDNDWINTYSPHGLARDGIITRAQADMIANSTAQGYNQELMREFLIANKYDGAAYENVAEGRNERQLAAGRGQPIPRMDTWIAFQPNQIKSASNKGAFTPSPRMQLTVQIAASIDPTISANTQFATINHISGVAASILQEPDVRRTLPSRFIKDGQNSFEQLVLGMSEDDVTSKRKTGFADSVGKQVNVATGKPFEFDPNTLINQLPVSDNGSSAQQRAMRDALLQLQKIEGFINRRLYNLKARKGALDVIVENKKRDLTRAEQNELDQVNTDIPVFERVVSMENVGIHAQVNRLRGKLRTGFLFQVSPDAKYYVPEHENATEDEVYKSIKSVPANLYYGEAASKQLRGDLAKMQLWLDNEANMEQGDAYESVRIQFRKLSEVTLDPNYTSNRARMKKTAFDSLAATLKAIGTTTSNYLFGRFYALENAIFRWNGEMEALGSPWSTHYANVKKAMNQADGSDTEFRKTVYNPLIALSIATPDGTVDPINKIIAAYNVTRPAQYKLNDKAAEAARGLLRATRATELKTQEMADSIGTKVQDEKLGKVGKGKDGRIRQRGLIRQGYITGRLAISKHFDSVWRDMAPVWKKTKTNEVDPLYNAPDLWKQGHDSFRAGVAPYFKPHTLRDFVSPLVFGAKQTFPSPSGIDSGSTVYAAQGNVRAAWNASMAVNPSGDMTTFIAELNRLEGGTDATEAKFSGMVMKSLTNMFTKMDRVANERQLASGKMGIPTIPEEVMNARTADDFPPEWVDYALYDQGSNKVILHSLALNHAFGRDGLTSGEFSSNMDAVISEVKALNAEYLRWKNDQIPKLSESDIKAKMGADKYGIAISAPDHLSMLKNIGDKMAFLVDPLSTQQGDLRLLDEILGLMAGATIQAPRSALQNSLDVLGPLYHQKFSTTALKAIADSVKFGTADLASGFLEWFGVHTHFLAGFANRNRELGAKDPDNYRSWRDSLTDYGTNNNLATDKNEPRLLAKAESTLVQLARRTKALINANPTDVLKELSNKAMKTDFIPNVPGDQALAPKLRMLGIFKSTSMYIANGMVFGQYNAYKDLVMRGMQFINSSPDPEGYAKRLVSGDIKLDPNQLGYTRKWMILNDRPAWDYMQEAIATKMGQGSVERMVGDAWLRTRKNPEDPVITNEQFSRIRAVTLSDIQLTSMTTNTPADMRSNPLLRAGTVFLSWPYLAMVRFPTLFQNKQNQYTWQAALDGSMALMMGVIPLTVAASLGMDWYDENLLKRKQNIRDIGAEALVPGMAPFVYPMATLERLARYGTGGFASEIVNGVISADDTRGALSVDSRVFLISQIRNIMATVGNVARTGNVDYQGAIRPLIHFMGGNGVLQYAQLANNLTGMSNDEAAVNERISIGNYLRAVGRDLKLSVIPTMQSSQGISNEVTPFIAQMELAAYSDDISDFQAAFAKAVQAYHKIHPNEDDPQAGVIRSFQARHPLRRVFRVNPTEGEYRDILDNLSDNGREAVSSGVRMFNKYLLKLGATPFEGKVEKKSTYKRIPSAGSIINSQLNAANAAYSSSFLD